MTIIMTIIIIIIIIIIVIIIIIIIVILIVIATVAVIRGLFASCDECRICAISLRSMPPPLSGTMPLINPCSIVQSCMSSPAAAADAAADAANAAAAAAVAAAAFCRSSAFPASMHLSLITSPLTNRFESGDYRVRIRCLPGSKPVIAVRRSPGSNPAIVFR